MDSFAAMFSTYFKSLEGNDYGNKPTDLPFRTGNVIEFSSPLLLVLLALRTFLHSIYVASHCILVISVFSYNFLLVVFAKAFLFSSVILKNCSPWSHSHQK